MKMNRNKNRIENQSLGLIALVAMGLSGCGMIGGKELSKGYKAPSTNFDGAGAVFKEVPYGAAVGTVSLPSFQTALTQDLDLLDMTMAEANSVRAVSTSVNGNLPEVGVASAVSPNTVFSYSKLYIAGCADKCRLDRANANRPNRLCTFDQNRAPNDPANAAAWDKSIRDMGALFWGRSDLTASEMNTLITLRNEISAAALAKTGGTPASANLTAFYAVCATMKLAPDAIVQ
jgi:hypothetical protein